MYEMYIELELYTTRCQSYKIPKIVNLYLQRHMHKNRSKTWLKMPAWRDTVFENLAKMSHFNFHAKIKFEF